MTIDCRASKVFRQKRRINSGKFRSRVGQRNEITNLARIMSYKHSNIQIFDSFLDEVGKKSKRLMLYKTDSKNQTKAAAPSVYLPPKYVLDGEFSDALKLLRKGLSSNQNKNWRGSRSKS